MVRISIATIRKPDNVIIVPMIRVENAGIKNFKEGNGRAQKCFSPVRVRYNVECPATSSFKKIIVWIIAIEYPAPWRYHNKPKEDTSPETPKTVATISVSFKCQRIGFSSMRALSYAIAKTGMSLSKARIIIITAVSGLESKNKTARVIKKTIRIVSEIRNVA